MPLSLLDIANSLKNAKVCLKIPELDDGHVVLYNNNPVSSAGGYCVVYKFQLKDGQYKALRIWHKDLSLLPDLPIVADEVAKELTRLNSNYFVDYKYYEKGILVNGTFYPAVVMDWCEGEDLKDYITSNIASPAKIREIAKKFKDMVMFFHKNKISHGDLQHGNIRIRPDGSICVLDYDSMCVPALEGKNEYIKGLPAFQHPTARDANERLTPKVDYFSEYVIYLSLLLIAHQPSLWTEEIKRCDDLLLFDISDLRNINTPGTLLYPYRNLMKDQIYWLMKDLQTFMISSDLNGFKPLEKSGMSFLPGDPTAHNSENQQPQARPTQIANIDIKAILDSFAKGGKKC